MSADILSTVAVMDTCACEVLFFHVFLKGWNDAIKILEGVEFDGVGSESGSKILLTQTRILPRPTNLQREIFFFRMLTYKATN